MGTILDDGLPDAVTDDKYADVMRCIRMADELTDRWWWKEEYYSIASGLLKPLAEEDPELKKLANSVRDKMHTARAMAAVIDYDRLCEKMKAAKTGEQYAETADGFQELQQKMKKRKANVKYVPADLKERFSVCADAEAKEKECRKILEGMLRRKRRNVLAGLVLIVLLAAGGVLFSKTWRFQQLIGQVEELAGDSSGAWARYKNAYKMSGDETVYQKYLTVRYEDGIRAYENGDMETAIAAFKKLSKEEHYLDSEAYYAKLELMSLAAAEPGDTLEYGDVKWLVLEKEGSRVFLLKKKVSEEHPYTTGDRCLWMESPAREYLNGEFAEEHFSAEESSAILETEVKSEDNSAYGTGSGEDTADRLFLLSVSEFMQYRDLMDDSDKCWWLRTAGAVDGTMCYVDTERNVMDFGTAATTAWIRLKPAMWVDTDTDITVGR